MTYLGKILGSETKIKILATLVIDKNKSFIEREIARENKSSISEINRQIPDLVKAGLVISNRIGKSKVYSINQKHFLYSPLKNLFVNLYTIYKKAALEVVDFAHKRFAKDIRTIILIGSLKEKQISEDFIQEPSDIDLIFIIRKKGAVSIIKKALLNYVNKVITFKYAITLYPFIITREEYLKRLTKNDLFILKSYSKGEILYGKKPRKFS